MHGRRDELLTAMVIHRTDGRLPGGRPSPAWKAEHQWQATSSSDGRRSRCPTGILEMPGLSLTERQAARLWHLEPEACRALFKALVQSGFLRHTPRGYVRANIG